MGHRANHGSKPDTGLFYDRCMESGEITEADAVALLDLMEWAEIDVIVDGGWGVDALLGHQTRAHLDLDIAIPADQRRSLRELLLRAGFSQIWTADLWEHNFVLEDDRRRRIDVHSFELDDDGRNVGGVEYQGSHLRGTGRIGERGVRCIPVDVLIGFHLGYAQDIEDYHDVLALCERFDRPLPAELERFR